MHFPCSPQPSGPHEVLSGGAGLSGKVNASGAITSSQPGRQPTSQTVLPKSAAAGQCVSGDGQVASDAPQPTSGVPQAASAVPQAASSALQVVSPLPQEGVSASSAAQIGRWNLILFLRKVQNLVLVSV